MTTRLEVIEHVLKVWGDDCDRAWRWLHHPNMLINMQKPYDLLNTPEGCEKVDQLIGQLEHGVGV